MTEASSSNLDEYFISFRSWNRYFLYFILAAWSMNDAPLDQPPLLLQLLYRAGQRAYALPNSVTRAAFIFSGSFAVIVLARNRCFHRSLWVRSSDVRMEVPAMARGKIRPLTKMRKELARSINLASSWKIPIFRSTQLALPIALVKAYLQDRFGISREWRW